MFSQIKKKIIFYQCWKNKSKEKLKNKSIIKKVSNGIFAAIVMLILSNKKIMAEPSSSIINDYLSGGSDTSDVVRILVILTILTVLPTIIMTVTAFPRIIIVLSFTRSAMGTQQMPPNQILIGIALILSFFVMSPVVTTIKDEAYDPYMDGQLDTQEAYNAAMEPIREFMFNQAKTEPESIEFFLSLYGADEKPESFDEIPTVVIMMSYITSELKKAFIMGFMMYIPFIVIDMIVASVLMSMGMMMMPPAMISLPFKVLLFILVDGWTLVFKTLILSFG